MTEFPFLCTKRLVLDRPTESDKKDLLYYLNQTAEFSENTLNIPFPYSENDAAFWLNEL